MLITDNSHDTYREDLAYMRLLMDRIFRTAYEQKIPIGPTDEDGITTQITELDSQIAELSRLIAAKSPEWKQLELGDNITIPELAAEQRALVRDSNGRFTKR